MESCPKCNQKLNLDEKASGLCFSCGATFPAIIPQDSAPSSPTYLHGNRVAGILKIIGIILMILGTIGSIILADNKQSFAVFLIAEFASIVSGMFFIGMSEIINLLEDIKLKR